MKNGKYFFSVQDVSKDLGIRTTEAKELIKRLNDMLEMDGRTSVIRDMVSRKFYEQVKETGFMYRPP